MVRKKVLFSITVFTPTYNRAYILSNLYESLKRQSFHNFEWLIIDDGSTDNTEELVESWKNQLDFFSIRYYKQENGGKCRAINHALDLAQGELFFTVDSDDYLTDDALEKVNKWFGEIAGNESIAGIVANRGYTPFKTVNYCFAEEHLDKSLLDMYSFARDGKKVFDGERAFVFYTEFHKKYKYPEFAGENFMTEAVAWNRMANDGFLMRFYNDVIWVFEYKEDGLTKAGNALFLKNPQGYGLWMREKAEFEKCSLLQLLKMYYAFTCELENLYDSSKIAQCIGTPKVLIDFFKVLHKIYRFIKESFLYLRKE